MSVVNRVARWLAVMGLILFWLVAVSPPSQGDSGEAAVAGAARYQRIVSLGTNHSCAITDAGGVECWGDNQFGQLGTNDNAGSTTPRVVNGISGALELGAGSGHTCVLIHGGSVQCWGLDTSGQLGNGDVTLTPQNHPVAVVNLTDVKHLVSGDFHSCALKTDNTVWCWGQDGMGQLGDGSPGDFSVMPEQVTLPAGQTPVDLTAGQWHTCARTVDATSVYRLYCWGHNGFGQLGDNTKTNRSTPVPVLSPESDVLPMTGVLAATAGAGHTCAILDRAGRPVFCWGQNSYGQLGHKTADDPAGDSELDPKLMVPSLRPLRVQYDADGSPLSEDPQDLANSRTVSAGANHTCVVLDGGGIDCWGQNGEGQLGYDPKPSTENRWEDAYLARPSGSTGLGVVGGGQHTCAVKAGSLACWGYDFYGQLGGYRDQVPSPTTVTAIRGATKIAVGTHVACVLRTDLPSDPPNTSSPVRPFCWGSNADGRLGIGPSSLTSSDLLQPVNLGTSDSAATEIRAGNGTVCAVPTGNPRLCWGRNTDGELGDHTTSSSSSPTSSTELGGATAYDLGGTFTAGAEHGTTCKASGGHALCWGYNGSRQLGDDTTTDSTTPVTVSYDNDDDDSTPLVPLPGVAHVAVGGDHACALTTGGNVWCWGANGAAQLGDNTTDARHGAREVQQDTDPDANDPLSGVTAIVAGNSHTCALLSSGKVRCWGDSSSGKLGRSGSGKQADKPVRWQPPPPELPPPPADLDNVTRIIAGDNHTCALRTGPSLVCWGDNSQDQVGAGGSSTAIGLVVLKAPTTSVPQPWIQDIAAGRDNTCAVLLDTTVSCWGDNSDGQIGDGIGARSIAPVTVGGTASLGANEIPQPPVLTATTTPGVAVDITVPLAGMDPDSSPAPTTLVGVGDPPQGTATASTASIHYVPDPGCHNDTFAYTVTDSVATVAGQVKVSMNCAPTAVADSVNATEDTTADFNLVANDTDPDGDTLSLASLPARSAHATLSIVAGKAHYVPDADYCGPDSFSYVVSDGNSPPADHTATGVVTVAVACTQDAPSAGTDAVSTPEDNPVLISVLGNDTDPDGDSLALVSVSNPAHGTAALAGTKVSYTPAADYCGPDTFTYKVTDGHTPVTGTVNVSVTCTGDSPRPASDSASTAEDTPTLVDVLANDTDPDPGDTLSLTPALGTPKHGTVSVQSGKVKYVPDPDYCGPDSFTYTVTDGTFTATATVTMAVTCVNDPPVARPDSATTPEDTTVHVHVLTNDTDVDGNALSIDKAGVATAPQHGTLTTTADSIDYTPAKDYCGPDSFSYDAVDPSGARSTALVSITVTCVDDPVTLAPVPNLSTTWGNAVSTPLSATDPDGLPTFSVVSGPGSIVGSAYQYTPAATDVGVKSVTVRASQGGVNADRSFTVTVSRRATTLVYDGATAGQLSDPALVGATLTDAVTNAPVQGVQVGFSLSPSSVSAATNASGRATTTLPASAPVGARTIQSSFAGNSAWLPSSTSASFTVTKESFTVTFGGTPRVAAAAAGATVTLTADLAEENDGNYAGALSAATVAFKTVTGTTLCTTTASDTTPGNARASCTTNQVWGAVPIVVIATSSSYSGLADVGVETIAPNGSGMAAGAGRVGADDFGFAAQPAKKGAPTGNAVHVVQSGSTAQVVSSNALSSLSTSCNSAKICKATIGVTASTLRTVDLTTGTSTTGGGSTMTVNALEPDRYAVAIAGAVNRTIGSATSPTTIDFGSIEIG